MSLEEDLMTDTSTTTTTMGRGAAAAEPARLEFPGGARRLTLRVEAGMPALYRARFGGARPSVHEEGGTVTIDYPRLVAPGWAGVGRRAAEVDLNPRAPWDLALGGIARMRADLRGLELRSLEVAGGASDVDLVLPAPRGAVPIRIRGGASAVSLHRPDGVAVHLRIGGGASRLTFDDEYFGAVGGGIRLQTHDADRAADRYEIDVDGGASRLTVTLGR
jgi:hypothetical protein